MQEVLIDTKCRQYSAGLQDQIDDLKTKFDLLEADKKKDRVSKKDHQRSTNNGINKRDDPKALKEICTTSSSLCTHYHPDHPDASHNKQTKYSPVVTTEIIQNKPDSKVKGMPTSCKDLQQLGHSSNGFYSIKKFQPNDKGTKIETVYCDFKTPTDSNGIHHNIVILYFLINSLQYK